MSEEIKQQNSELSEQLRSRVSENETMRNNIEDLHKKLEMAELMIQQVGQLIDFSTASHFLVEMIQSLNLYIK